jgi:subfamily B ATP-binding cassette protein MsbA
VLSNVQLQSIALGATGFLTALGPILVLWFGVLEVWAGRLSLGTLMAFYAYLGMLYQPIVGPSGAGKSTIAKLLPRFYDVTAGRITIDGIDIREVTLKSLRQQIAIVPQEPILFSGTITENLRYGRPDAAEEDIRRAAQAAFADSFITQLPEGYNTEIGERGVRLSGGQKQRLAIARAFLKNAPIVILDEPTSSLDAESEELIKKALQKLLKDRTALIIAHRLSTIEHADRVVVLDHGTIVEEGPHKELLKLPNGLYRRYAEYQLH